MKSSNLHIPQCLLPGQRAVSFIPVQWTRFLVCRFASIYSHITDYPNLAEKTGKHNQLTLTFIGNNASHKFEELENDAHVNVSFLNTKTTSWASYVPTATNPHYTDWRFLVEISFSGKAKVTRDPDTIKNCFSSTSVFFPGFCVCMIWLFIF